MLYFECDADEVIALCQGTGKEEAVRATPELGGQYDEAGKDLSQGNTLGRLDRRR